MNRKRSDYRIIEEDNVIKVQEKNWFSWDTVMESHEVMRWGMVSMLEPRKESDYMEVMREKPFKSIKEAEEWIKKISTTVLKTF